MILPILIGASAIGTLWSDTKRTMIVPFARLSPAAKNAYRAGVANRERLLIVAVQAHPEDWSLLCVARAWRDGSGAIEPFRRIAGSQWTASAQRGLRRTLGRRCHALADWWDNEARKNRGYGYSADLKISEVQSPEEACLVLDAQSNSTVRLTRMREFATEAIQKFGDYPGLFTWRSRARFSAYINAYPDGDPRAKNPGGVRTDNPGALADARRAVQLAPKEPGVLASASDVFMRLKDPAGPSTVRRYAALNDPWTERRSNMAHDYSSFFN